MLVVADAVAFKRAVDDWILLQSDDGGAHEERHEGEPRAVALFESVLELVTQIDNASQIHFEHAVDVSAGAAGLRPPRREAVWQFGRGCRDAPDSGGGRGARL